MGRNPDRQKAVGCQELWHQNCLLPGSLHNPAGPELLWDHTTILEGFPCLLGSHGCGCPPLPPFPTGTQVSKHVHIPTISLVPPLIQNLLLWLGATWSLYKTALSPNCVAHKGVLKIDSFLKCVSMGDSLVSLCCLQLTDELRLPKPIFYDHNLSCHGALSPGLAA
jgi:hypothetical protein